MTAIDTATLQRLLLVLEEVPDVDDCVIVDKTLCAYTNSGGFTYINFGNEENPDSEENGNLPIPSNMTLVDFGLKAKTIKIMSENYTLPVSFKEENKVVTFVIGSNQVFASKIPIINNRHRIDEYRDIISNSNELFEIEVETSTINKLKSFIDLYKAQPTLAISTDSEGVEHLAIKVESSSKADDYEISITDSNLFDGTDVTLSEPLKMHRALFLFNFSSETIRLKFYNQEQKLVVRLFGQIQGRDVEYAFISMLEMSLENMLNIDDVNLNLNM